MSRTAIVLGATGLVGNEVLNLLLNDSSYASVKVFTRRPLQIMHPKLEEHIIDFRSVSSYKELIKGDCLFCCLGTTIKTAGSKEAFIKVDRVLPFEFAEIAKGNGCRNFLLVSSLGANKASSNFYLKVKGEVEEDITGLQFEKLAILRPSMLLGKRPESRPGESIGKLVMKVFSFIFVGKLKKYRAIHALIVAKAMIRCSSEPSVGIQILESDQIQETGN